MSCTPDRWTCPHCGQTTTRGGLRHDEWPTYLRTVQTVHGRTCTTHRPRKENPC